MVETFDDFDTQAQCEEFYKEDEKMCEEEGYQRPCVGCDDCAPKYWQSDLCTAQLGGDCNGCGDCAIQDCIDLPPNEGM